MNPLFYILKRTFINYVKELKKKPVSLFLYLFLILMLIFVITISILVPANRISTGSPETYGAIVTAVLLMVFYFGVKQGMTSGSSFFRLADVNLVFTAPISPTKVLIYGFIKQLYTTFFLIFFFLFQVPNLRNFLPITGEGIIIIFAATFFLVFTMSVMGLLAYSITSRSASARIWGDRIINALSFILGLTLLYKLLVYKDLSKAALEVLNSKFFIYVPFLGWLKGILLAAVYGININFFINTLLCFLVLALMIYAIHIINTDYYEDVLAATERKEELIKMKKEGKGNLRFSNKKVRKLKEVKFGKGPSAIFYRQLLEYRKSGIPFIDKITFVMVGIGIGSSYIFHNDSINFILYFSVYILFFFSLQGKWSQELSKHYIYLIPSSSAIKLFYATLADAVKNVIDGLILFIITGFMTKSNPLTVILCVITYVSFGTIYTFGDVLSRRLLGETHSKNLQVFVRMFLTLFIIAPGIVISIIFQFVLRDSGMLQNISYLILLGWNLTASFIILLLSMGIFETLEMR